VKRKKEGVSPEERLVAKPKVQGIVGDLRRI